MARFNIIMHELVPEHHLVPKEEEDEILKELGVDKEGLPKIKITDPAVRVLEEINGDRIEEGRLVKVVRNSHTAGRFVVYRAVIYE